MTDSLKGVSVDMLHIVVDGVPGRTETALLTSGIVGNNVDARDVVAITDYMMGKNPENFNIKNADVNGDGVINIADIIQITNQILSKE